MSAQYNPNNTIDQLIETIAQCLTTPKIRDDSIKHEYVIIDNPHYATECSLVRNFCRERLRIFQTKDVCLLIVIQPKSLFYGSLVYAIDISATPFYYLPQPDLYRARGLKTISLKIATSMLPHVVCLIVSRGDIFVPSENMAFTRGAAKDIQRALRSFSGLDKRKPKSIYFYNDYAESMNLCQREAIFFNNYVFNEDIAFEAKDLMLDEIKGFAKGDEKHDFIAAGLSYAGVAAADAYFGNSGALIETGVHEAIAEGVSAVTRPIAKLIPVDDMIYNHYPWLRSATFYVINEICDYFGKNFSADLSISADDLRYATKHARRQQYFSPPNH